MYRCRHSRKLFVNLASKILHCTQKYYKNRFGVNRITGKYKTYNNPVLSPNSMVNEVIYGNFLANQDESYVLISSHNFI